MATVCSAAKTITDLFLVFGILFFLEIIVFDNTIKTFPAAISLQKSDRIQHHFNLIIDRFIIAEINILNITEPFNGKFLATAYVLV